MAIEYNSIEPAESHFERRNLLLKKIPPETIRKAWFTLSHLLLEDGARVVDMGCDDGAMTYAMAAMAPKLKFIGLDKSKRQINKAKEQYELHNLEFKIGDAAMDIFEEESLDAIINSFVLHEIFSSSRYNERIVNDTLKKHFKALRKGGIMFIHDYARTPPDQFVIIEMPDTPSIGKELAKLSETDLLVWYSEHARPRNDAGTGGFFLEELPARFPKTRLFRLPHKWAYEFVLRKDDRAHWEKELPMEYTFFTPRDFRQALRILGARVQYSGPHWDENYINEKFEGRFRLFADDGTPLGDPPTSFVAVGVKMGDRKSLMIEERRPSLSHESNLKIATLRDQKTGQITDVVSRGIEINEIIPYHVDEEGHLKIYLHDGIARSITNAVPRSGINIDERTWSGHMVEPITVDAEAMGMMEEFDVKHSARFARDYLGLKPRNNAILNKGPDYYPAPDYIDERVFTYYLNVEEARGAVTPKKLLGAGGRFQAKGEVREMDAQKIFDAITVGMIPNARLELQILALFRFLDIKVENWTSKKIAFQTGKITGQKSLRKILNTKGTEKGRFKEIKGRGGQIRAVNSIFVEEGQTKGSVTGLSSEDVDFVIFDDKTINTVVILPLTKDVKGDVHAGIMLEEQPVPQRHEGNGLTMSCPSFNLPPGVTNITAAKKFIAEKFGVVPEMVFKMGESYYSHISITPQKIHPFAVAVPPNFLKDSGISFMPIYQILLVWQSTSREHKFSRDGSKRPKMVWDTNMAVVLARSYRFLPQDMNLDAKMKASAILRERFGQKKPEWSLPVSYEMAPAVRINASTDTPAEYQSQEAIQPDEAPSIPEIIQQLSAPKPQSPLQRLTQEFEQELDELIETLESDLENNPRPEKW